MNKKQGFTLMFLLVLSAGTIMELVAAFDGSKNTTPLTYLIVDNIPSWIGIPIISFCSGWLFIHFIKHYQRKKK